jgi:hypothetical protein
MRLVRRTLADGEEEYLSTSDDNKRGLALSADGTAAAFVSELGGKEQVIYGRYTPEGAFRLASVTDTTGFFSEYLRLSDDGKYLLGYGSRRELHAMLDAAGQPAAAGDGVQSELEAALAAGEPLAGAAVDVGDVVLEGGEVPAEDELAEEEYVRPRPPAQRERLGVIRLNLSRSPDSWKITTVHATFVAEASAIFDTAGPFAR